MMRSNNRSILCYLGISAKRYVLFNLDRDGSPILRKASAHGLGHLQPPYQDRLQNSTSPAPKVNLEKIEVKLWQHDLWCRMIEQTLAGNSTEYNPADLTGFDYPAVSRYAATTSELLKWFKVYNANRPYHEQVRPRGFMLALYGNDDESHRNVRAVAPFDKNITKASLQCFDRDTGKTIKPEQLKTYQEILAQYHLHPEAKFLNGDFANQGVTQRRHVRVSGVEAIHHIGKEAHRWEEQFFIGADQEAEIRYGNSPDSKKNLLNKIHEAAKLYYQNQIADMAGISTRYLAKILKEEVSPSIEVLDKLLKAIHELEKEIKQN